MRFILIVFSLMLAACGKSVPEDTEARKPRAAGQERNRIARLCLSNRPDRLEGCKALVSERWSDDDCHTFAFYELRTPKFAIDQKAAEESKVICESDLGIRPYDGKEFVRLTGRAVNLENKIIEKKVQRKDAIDDIDIERLEKELKQVRGEKFQMQVTP